MNNENIEPVKRDKVEYGVVLDLGPERTEGLIRVGKVDRPTCEVIAFNPIERWRTCVTGENELLWVPGDPSYQPITTNRRIAFERRVDRTGKLVVGRWTLSRSYLRTRELADIAERLAINYEGDDEAESQWFGAYSSKLGRRVDLEGALPEEPTDKHTLFVYDGNGRAIEAKTGDSMRPLFNQLVRAKVL